MYIKTRFFTEPIHKLYWDNNFNGYKRLILFVDNHSFIVKYINKLLVANYKNIKGVRHKQV